MEMIKMEMLNKETKDFTCSHLFYYIYVLCIIFALYGVFAYTGTYLIIFCTTDSVEKHLKIC